MIRLAAQAALRFLQTAYHRLTKPEAKARERTLVQRRKDRDETLTKIRKRLTKLEEVLQELPSAGDDDRERKTKKKAEKAAKKARKHSRAGRGLNSDEQNRLAQMVRAETKKAQELLNDPSRLRSTEELADLDNLRKLRLELFRELERKLPD